MVTGVELRDVLGSRRVLAPYPLLWAGSGGWAWGVSRRFLKGSIMDCGRPGLSGDAAPYGGAPGGPTCSPAMGIRLPGGIPGRWWGREERKNVR